ncbi:TraA family conjugative transfer protein [Succinimonas sp.]|uniref:TraA family conjugative transfer protein n=1 Tax=Succinimonas sp. TaxID=1936151 RepID=UPI00386886AD
MKIWHRVNWGLIAAVLGLCVAGDVLAGTGGDEFSDVWETLKEWIQGTLGRVIAGSMILVGIVAGVARQSISAFAVGIGGGIGMYNTPTVIESVLSASLESLSGSEAEMVNSLLSSGI